MNYHTFKIRPPSGGGLNMVVQGTLRAGGRSSQSEASGIELSSGTYGLRGARPLISGIAPRRVLPLFII